MGPQCLPMYYHELYSFMLEYGYLYAISLVLAIIVYFHAFFKGVEPALTWAFISFAIPVVGALLYLIYFLCSWKGLCVSRKEREKAEEIVKKWENQTAENDSDTDNRPAMDNTEPYRKK
jgi:hypothetical protein